MRSFSDYLREQLGNEEFAREYRDVSRDVDFALTLTRVRENLGLTQVELARRTGLKQPMIARIEGGQIPTVPTLQRIAAALNSRVVITSDEMFLEPLLVHDAVAQGNLHANEEPIAIESVGIQPEKYCWYFGSGRGQCETVFTADFYSGGSRGLGLHLNNWYGTKPAFDTDELLTMFSAIVFDTIQFNQDGQGVHSPMTGLSPSSYPLELQSRSVLYEGVVVGAETGDILSRHEEKSNAELALAA